MSSGEFLSINPEELQFPFVLKKQISCTMQVCNNTHNYVALKVKTTAPKKFCVRPKAEIVLPYSTLNILVIMQAQKEVPVGMKCQDKFLIQSVITNPKSTIKDITSDMFNKKFGNLVDEYKMKVKFVSPPKPVLATVREASGGVSALKPSVSDNETTRALVQAQNDLIQAKALISTLMEEKNVTVQLNNMLQQDMESFLSKKTELEEYGQRVTEDDLFYEVLGGRTTGEVYTTPDIYCQGTPGSKSPTLTETLDVSMIYTQLLIEQKKRLKLEEQLHREIEENRKLREESGWVWNRLDWKNRIRRLKKKCFKSSQNFG